MLNKILKKIFNKPKNNLEQNMGMNLCEWVSRSEEALKMIRPYIMNQHKISVADCGCGKQTLRKLIPSWWNYIPIDYCARTPDTIICDLNKEFFEGGYNIIFCLGVLEYLNKPLDVLFKVAAQSEFFVFSYNGPTTIERRLLQGWSNSLCFEEIESSLNDVGARIIEIRDIGNNERIYCCYGNGLNQI